MRHILFASFALLGLAVAGTASAGDNTASIEQTGSYGTASQDVTGSYNRATIEQAAAPYGTSATQVQNGNSNVAEITHGGGSMRYGGEVASQTQIGDRNHSTTSMTGAGSATATTTITGSDNVTAQTQVGYMADAKITISGGNGNHVGQMQSGGTLGASNSMITYIGGGNNNDVTQMQLPGTIGSQAETDVTGDFNHATITQSGALNHALQQQFSNHDTATIAQNGNALNNATQRQH